MTDRIYYLPRPHARMCVYALIGLLSEVSFTAVRAAWHGDATLAGNTWLWMAPVWAIGGLTLEAVHGLFYLMPRWARALLGTLCLFTLESVAGTLSRHAFGRVLWDYGGGAWVVVQGACDLRLLPAWFALSYFFVYPWRLARGVAGAWDRVSDEEVE